MSEPQPGQIDRADRILDAAKDLLLRWGYRRVAIDEIARHAGVGKGTVYLHWRSREQLFFAVGAREAVSMLSTVVTGMRGDPKEIALHRYMRRFFLEAMSRPVLRAIFTRDTDVLGRFLSSPARRPLQSAKLLASREYLAVLAENGLLRADLRPEDLDYTLPAVVFGFFGIDPLLSPETHLGLPDKADQLAGTLRHAFGPAKPPPSAQIAAAAPRVIAIFDRHTEDYRRAAYEASTDER
ncbi:helix-turn-helix domain-containing protein [Actinoplanes sp. NEAU-A12]|uniref:Helix-turn-helix domain-containing protein n=1 Tax=Actinoplanes sandaracinus TaxID=3045177 RepID=A0ABT6WSU1_9ACTN|nr:TetR/AcrR family transcriptional regulator [Actinoplanes sandaracinus]MDI6102807.1 helix-turn-helix domain-containing protein [Actinoplanes sandaracinus]